MAVPLKGILHLFQVLIFLWRPELVDFSRVHSVSHTVLVDVQRTINYQAPSSSAAHISRNQTRSDSQQFSAQTICLTGKEKMSRTFQKSCIFEINQDGVYADDNTENWREMRMKPERISAART